MKSYLKKGISVILSLMITLCMMPSPVFALDEPLASEKIEAQVSAEEQTVEDTSDEVEEPSEKENAEVDKAAEDNQEAATVESSEEDGSEDSDSESSTDIETVKETAPAGEEIEEVKMPAFNQSKTSDGVKITVKAAEGIFPEGAYLDVRKATEDEAARTDKAVESKRGDNVNVALTYTFDIKVLDKDGKELQPEEGQKVEVLFTADEVSNENLSPAVYHIKDEGNSVAEALDINEKDDTVSAETDGFSYYTVEFTYGDLDYSMSGDSEIALSAILENIGLTGTVTKAVSSNPELFSVEKKNGEWTVTANKAFQSEETLTVTIDGTDYVIKVTDDVTADPHDHNHTGWTAWNNTTSLPVNGGKYYLNTNVTLSNDFYFSNNVELCLNGHTITMKGSDKIIGTGIGKKLTIYDEPGNSGGIVFNNNRLAISDNSVFNLYGGTFKGCTRWTEGALTINGSGIFNMYGGVFSGNKCGSALRCTGGYARMNIYGGEFTGNELKNAPIDVQYGAVYIYDVTISGNSGRYGGIIAGGNVYMSGGTITGNTGKDAAVYAGNKTLNLSGAVYISGNKLNTGEECNVKLDSNNYRINISGELTNTTPIGITVYTPPTGDNTVEFTTGLNGKGTAANFSSDNPNCAVIIKNKEAHLISHSHTFNYTAAGDTITAECVNTTTPCSLQDNKTTLKVVKPARTVYGGSESAEATFEGTIPGVTPAAEYYKGTDKLSAAPKDAGTYKAQVSLTGSDGNTATAYVEYTIEKADITPVVNIEGWDYGQPAKTPSVTAESNPGNGYVTYEYYTDEACTQKTTSAQGATEEGGAPSYGGDYWVKATVAETDNYNSGTGKKKFTINATSVKVTGLKYDSKVYDGTTEAVLDISEAKLEGVPTDEDVQIESATGKFSDKNVGEGKTISGIVIVLSGSKAGGYKATADPAELEGDITAKPVTVSGITASNKTYDGNRTAALTFTGASFAGKIDGDDLSVKGKDSQDGTFDNKNVGTDKTVTLPSLVLVGNDAANYQLAASGQQETATADITAKEVTVNGITANSKTYDGETDATLDYSNVTLGGLVNGDKLSVTATGTFENKNVGENKTVNISDLALGGADKDNYALAGSGQQTDTKASITAKEVGLEWSDTDLTYNGNAQKPKVNATGLVDGDECDVNVDGAQTDANAKSGTDSYTATAASLSNANYKLPDSKTTEFTIAQKEVKVTCIIADDKTYDGTVIATLTFTGASFEGLVEGDTLSVQGKDSQIGTFDDKNVGTDKTVTLPELELGEEDAGNYTISDDSQTTATAAITAKEVSVTAEDKSKTYLEDDPELTYTADELVTGDKFTGALERAEGEDAGTYDINQGTLSAGDNYTINYTKGTFTINKATANSVTASIEGWTYGDSPNKPSATATYGQDTVTFAYSNVKDGEYKAEVPTNAGTWYVKATVPETDNYAGAVSEPTEFTIAKKEVGLKWADTAFTYNGKAQKPTATATGLVDGDECNVTVDGAQTDANAKTGTDDYTATATGLSNDNYKLPESNTTKFNIAPKEITKSMLSVSLAEIKGDGSEQGPTFAMEDQDVSEPAMKEGEDFELTGETKSSVNGTHFVTVEGKGNYTGSLDTSWMMYNKKSNNEKEPGTDGRGDFEIFVDINQNTAAISVSDFTIDMAKKLLSDEELARYNAGENVTVYLEIQEELKSEVISTDRSLLDDQFKTEGAKDIRWFDITVWKKVGNDAATQVHDTITDISINIEVPDEYKSAPSGYTRVFYFGRAHEGEASIIKQTADSNISVTSHLFSTYAMAYKDTKIPDDKNDSSSGDDDNGNNNGDNSNRSNNGGDNNGSSSGKTNNSGDVQTGDSNNLIPCTTALICALVCAMATGFVLIRRRKTEE